MTLRDFIGLRKEGAYIVRSCKTFRRETNTEKPFNGKLMLVKVREPHNNYLAYLDIDLNEGAADGSISIALKR